MTAFSPFRFRVIALTALAAAALGACSGNDKDLDLTKERPVEAIYNDAANNMDQGNYQTAAKLFNEVERQHPYSQWATRAQLMSAYGSYKAGDYDEATIALDRFIRLHPGDKDIDYAYYLRGLCFYDQITDVARDQKMTQEALDSFDSLIRLYPNSRYTRDATLKRDLTLDHLAGKEMDIGRYYLTRGYYTAGIKRFMNVVRDYQTTTHVPEALHRLVESYIHLGMNAEAMRVASVLGYNYPGSRWYEDSFRLLDDNQRKELMASRGIVDRTIDTILKPD